MIDTWVGGRPNSFLAMNTTSGVCQIVTDMDTSNGQAFDLQADLHLYKKKPEDGTTTSVVPVFAATPFAKWAELGEIESSTGRIGAGGAISFAEAPQCAGGDCAEHG